MANLFYQKICLLETSAFPFYCLNYGNFILLNPVYAVYESFIYGQFINKTVKNSMEGTFLFLSHQSNNLPC